MIRILFLFWFVIILVTGFIPARLYSVNYQANVFLLRDTVPESNATFAAGCFWHQEYVFGQIQGVTRTEVGYCGGKLPFPSYGQVHSGRTGHVEAVRVYFDSTQVSYAELLEVFWENHDPQKVHPLAPARRSQYRAIIFYHNSDQLAQAKLSKQELEQDLGAELQTQIRKAPPFFRAENHHQKYYSKKGKASCEIH